MNRLTQALLAATMTVAPFAAEAGSEQDGLPLDGATEVLSFTTDEGSWLSIDVTPEGDSLVFDLLGDLYRLPTEGGEARRSSSGRGYDGPPGVCRRRPLQRSAGRAVEGPDVSDDAGA